MILNTQQIILLCLLVSFITAIATGIVVVSLMQQSPEPVTTTINRVIERTIEIANQPVEDIKNIITDTPPSQPKKEVVTVVVNQEEQSINAVAQNEQSIVRLTTNNSSADFVTLGVILNQAGDIVVDRRRVDKRTVYRASYGSRTFPVSFVGGADTADFLVLSIEGDNPKDFTPATFGSSDSLRLAQSVISLSGATQTSISTGEITSLNKTGESLSSITTSVDPLNVLTGSVLLNLSGSIIGIRVANIEDKTVFMPIKTLINQLSPPSNT